ncbi:MAG TPA: DUF1553 domain-containing protein, partial [Verrucomicrobiae bacterium]|nr:DUF1553 domain-containing protein [Verrucomicrobiae bacterium]
MLSDLPHNSPEAPELRRQDSLGDFSRGDFDGWSVQDEAFGASPSPAGDFVVGEPQRPVLALLTEPAANSACISRKLEGVLRSPTFRIERRYAHILASGSGCRVNVRVDNFTMIRDPIYGGLKQPLDSEPLHWISIDLEAWKGHRAYFEFDDLATPDPTDDKKFSDLGYLTVSRVILSDDPAPHLSWSRSPLFSAGDFVGATNAEELAQLYQHATVSAIQAWMNQAGTPAQLRWLDWLNRESLLAGEPQETSARCLAVAVAEIRSLEDSIPEHARAVGMVDGTGLDENVFIRGNHKTLGNVVPRRFLQALGGSDQTNFKQGSGRLELAECLTDLRDPLLARVMVNRVWLHLFGRGIVPTPDDFGALGQPPTHPELLDWLAEWYRTEGGWSTKRLIRLLVTSRTYGLSSTPSGVVAEEKDPQDLLWHRMAVRRLESEPIRDAIVAISG